MPSLDVRRLSMAFDHKEILHDISFGARPGDIVSVIGPSGCGKTTLFRCILGELEPTAGSIHLDGEDVTQTPVEKRGVAIVYQNYALFPHLTVEENVAYGLRARGRYEAEAAKRVKEMLELVQLPLDTSARYPHDLSGGERQRVALARALAVEPRILLLDEAFAALDATTRSGVVQQVRAIVKRMNVTTLLITHDQEEAFLFSKRVLVLNEGRVVTMGTPDSVMTHKHPFIQDFVKMVLLTTSKVESDGRHQFVTMENGQKIPVGLTGVKEGDEVHIMVKKSGASQSIEVWPYERDERP